MAYATAAYWDDYYTPDADHIDWLCQYSTLRTIVLSYLNNWEPPLPAILLLGTGLSTFAEELYDTGFSPIVVVDCASAPTAVHRQRAAAPPRSGLLVVQGDVTEPEWPELDARGLKFGIVVDKGVIDCTLSGPGGIDTAAAAVARIWSRMSTPGVWISVSHSPPADRRDLYGLSPAVAAGSSSVYWHDVKVKRVLLPPLEYAATSTLPGPETVEDYDPTAATECDHQAQETQPEGEHAADKDVGSHTGADTFRDDVAYIYLLTK